MSVWAWLKLTACLWLLRKMVKVTRWLLLAAAAVAAWPVTLVAVVGYVAAWLRGWPAVRLSRAAAACLLPVTAVWLVAEARRHPAWQAIALAPVRDWERGWQHVTIIGVVRTFLLVAPAAIPAGLGLAALAWAWRTYAMTTGIGGWLASAPITFDARQWKRQVRTAKGRTAAPGSVPLLARAERIPVGGTIRTIGHRWHPVFAVPHLACARHMVIIGATGSGKTNLMMRLWAGWFTAALAAAWTGRGRRPLLVVLDCKGGRDARTKADRTRRLLYGAGARRVAIWPDEARLSLWDLPPNDLAVLLYQMIDSGTGAAAYYADIMQAALTLAITAPGGPPLNAAAFLDRLDVRWLQGAWGDGLHAQQLARVRGAARHLPDIQLRFATHLTDERVRAAWRTIAAATHPDRPGGGDVARYTEAAAAYAVLRTPWGRSEACADLGAAIDDTSPLPVVPLSAVDGDGPPALTVGSRPAGPRDLLAAVVQLPARVRHGRPLRLVIRALTAAVLSLAVLALIPGQPAAPALVTGLITWFLLTGRSDLAPPPARG